MRIFYRVCFRDAIGFLSIQASETVVLWAIFYSMGLSVVEKCVGKELAKDCYAQMKLTMLVRLLYKKYG